MKKIVLLLSAVTLFASCTDDITGLNDDVKNATSVPAALLFTNAEKNMVDQMQTSNVNQSAFRLFTQHLTETTYTDESNYDLVTRTIPDNHWTTIYRDVLKDLQESKKVLATEVYTGTTQEIADQNTVRENKNAIIDIFTAYGYYVLVDTFGDVPYSEALDVNAHTLPKYDDAETVYRDLISKLTAAVAAIDETQGSFGAADIINGGDVVKWQKFANSLRLKMAINMDDIDHAYASAQAIAAVNDGVIMSNADNTALQYQSGSQASSNPLYVDVVASGRDDFVPTSTIIDQMNALNDPRRAVYFTQIGGIYEGGTPGASNNFTTFSHIGPTLLEPDFEGVIMSYTEVEFLLAEAVERGIAVGGTAEQHYNAAILASMEYWNVSTVDGLAYLAQPGVAYTTATGTWQQKIGEQSYLALYDQSFEAWTNYRRLDYPVLIAPADAAIAEVPKRYTYPAAEQTLNSANYTDASAAIGGDDMTTKLFWDVN